MTAHRIPCPSCDRRFRSKAGLAEHTRVKHPRPVAALAEATRAPKCQECGNEETRLVGGDVIYPHRPDLSAKKFWLCRCGAYCGCHPGTAAALGFPCGASTRRARSAAHAAFDPLWRAGHLSRSSAYARLADKLKINPKDCHIGMMSEETALCVPAVVDEIRIELGLLVEERAA